jgi:cytochrome c oxidase cbb3-type subunit III
VVRTQARNSAAIGMGLAMAILAAAQAPAPAPARGGGYAASYPPRPPGDPAMVARGQALYGVQCALCHGEDARGGDGGPNLIRGSILLNDQNGELLTPVLQNGRLAEGMPKFDFTAPQIADIDAFLHSFRVSGYDISRKPPPTIVVGDAKAGEAYFQAKCASCHSAAGDLKGLASRIPDARTLQQRWLLPGGGRGGPASAPVTVTVTSPSGQKTEGRLVRIDDFVVTILPEDGTSRSFRRDGEVPQVEMHDPLRAHRDWLRVYTDKDIHDVTAYLVTLK